MPVNTARFTTTEAYVSGGLCGPIWWPMGAMCGKPYRANLRGPWGILDRFSEPVSFRDALLSVLNSEGGDFQTPAFTADTRITVVRKRADGNGRYTVHVWERELSDLSSVSDLVNADAYTGDFMGEDY